MEGFLDGAVFHNNPVRIANYESKLLWPDAEDFHPDILLSIGTGHYDADMDGLLDASRSDRRRLQIRKVFNQVKPAVREKRSIAGLKAFTEFESWLTIFKRRVESVLDAELTWKEFRKDVVGTSSPIAAERYIRVNPRTKHRTPKMDDKTQIHILHEEVKSGLCTHGMRTKIEEIARRLVAGSFYFEKSGPSREAGDHITIQGACHSNDQTIEANVFKEISNADSLPVPIIYATWVITYANISDQTFNPFSAYKK